LTFTMIALAYACGGDDQNGNDAGNDVNNGNDSGGNDSGGNETGTDSGPKPSKANFGSVSFSETKIQNNTTYTASAAFFATPDGGTTSSGACTGTQVGSCCYTPPSDGGTTGPTPTAVSAGGITIKDGNTTIGTMTPNGTTYPALSSGTTNTLKWTDGDSLAVSAAGDTVHAFSGSVTSVALLAGVTPALSFAPGTTISKSQNFTISWTAGTGAISLVLTQTAAQGVITCSATTDPGTLTVDKSLLANFTALTGAIVLSRTSTADASPDNADVTLSSSTSTTGSTAYAN
jgi:hypothetical protein